MSGGVSGSGDERAGEGKGWVADVSRFASLVKRLELSVSALLGAGPVITCPRYARHFSEGLNRRRLTAPSVYESGTRKASASTSRAPLCSSLGGGAACETAQAL